MNGRRFGVVVATGTVFLLATLQADGVGGPWSAADDFSPSDNPNGVWSYGWSASTCGGLTLYDQMGLLCLGCNGVVNMWFDELCVPNAFHNSEDMPVACADIFMDAGELVLHPGASNEKSVLRWTAPITGVFDLDARFELIDASDGSTDVHICDKSGEVFVVDLVGFGDAASFKTRFCAEAGESLVITVGFGGDDFVDDSTAMDVTIAMATCVADIDGSGAVDFGDILAILAAWGNAGGPEDLDGSGTVDFGDILVVLGAWGPCE